MRFILTLFHLIHLSSWLLFAIIHIYIYIYIILHFQFYKRFNVLFDIPFNEHLEIAEDELAHHVHEELAHSPQPCRYCCAVCFQEMCNPILCHITISLPVQESGEE